MALIGVSDLIVPLAGGPMVILVIVSQFLFGIGFTGYMVGQVSLRQAITPDRFQGRVNATMRVALAGTVPIGAISGGALGESFGLRAALFVAAAGELLAVVWLC